MLKKIISIFTAVTMLMMSVPIVQAAYTNETTPDGTVKITWDFNKVAAIDVVDDATGEAFVTEIPSPKTTTYPMVGFYHELEFNCMGNSGAYVELEQPNGANNIDRINLYQGSYVKFTAPEDGQLTIIGKAKKGSKLYCHTEFTDNSVSSLISASSDTEVPQTVSVTAGTVYYIFNTQTAAAYQLKTLMFVSGGAESTPKPTPTPEPTSTPVSKPIQTVEPLGNRIISFDDRYIKVSIEDTDAVLYTASYEADGSLKSVEAKAFDKAGEYSMVLKNNADKAMLWDSNMKPYDVKEINNGPEIPSKEISLDRTSYPLYVGTASRTNFATWEDQGSSVTVTAALHNSEYDVSDIQWSVSDDTTIYLKSTDKNTAEIKGKRTGFALVTAALPNGEKAVCSISVIDNAARLTTQRIEFNTDRLNLSSGQSAALKTIVYPKDIYQNGMLNENLIWESSDTSVASVQNGKITAVANGTAIITATSADVGRSAVCSVTVKDGITAGTISASNEILDITVGDTGILDTHEENIVWKSDNSYIADVDENGIVTAYSNSNVQKVSSDGMEVSEEKGTVKIYATAQNGGAVAEYILRVNDASVNVESVNINKNEISLPVGESKNITAVVAPSKILDKNIDWSSSNESVVSVNKTNDTIYGAAQAVLTAKKAGTAIITAQSGDKTDTCTVTVTDGIVKISNVIMENTKEIDIDEVYQFVPQFTENASHDKIYWLCTDETIATLDREGNVQGYQAGTVKIYAIAADSLTGVQVAKMKELQEIRTLGDNADLADILRTAVYAECSLTVKDSSPYLRNLHTGSEGITENSINLLWNRATQLDSGDCKKYVVYVNGEHTAVTEKLGFTANNLEASTQYQFKVSAVDEDENELASEEITVETKEKSTVINVLDYGAKGNGLVTDTYAIQSAINDCPENGTVWLPGEGRVYYSGALFLKDNMTFKVDGILIGSIDPKDYPRHITKWEGWRKLNQSASEWANSNSDSNKVLNNHCPHSSLINAGMYDEGENGETGPYNSENITICGIGQINANGFILGYNEGPNRTYDEWSSIDYLVKDPTIRGRAITAHNLNGLLIKDITIAYSPSWTTHLIYNNNVTIDHAQVISQGNGNGGKGTGVKNAAHIPNGDGIDPESCTNVNVFNTRLMTGDDSFTMKSGRNREGNELDKPNAYIRVTDCVTEFSLGGYGYGSENAAGAHDVLFQNIRVDTVAMYGFWFKTNKARGGISENIQIRDSYVTGANSAVYANHTYSSSTANPASSLPVLRYVTLENVNGGNNGNGLKFEGLSGSDIYGVSVRGGSMNNKQSSINYGRDFMILDCADTEWTLNNASNINILTTSMLEDTELVVKRTAYKLKEIDNENRIIYAYQGTSDDEVLDGIESLLGGTQTYIISNNILTVTAPDGKHTAEYVIDKATDIPIDAYINDLIITSGDKELLKGFDREVTQYQIRASKAVTVVDIKAITNDINATVAITNNGVSFDGTLNAGVNEIAIAVTSSDNRDNKTYTVTIDNSYFIAEDFSSVIDDTWGFSGNGGASVKVTAIDNTEGLTAGALKLITSNGTGKNVSKTLDREIAEANQVHVSFDWQSNVIKGNSRYSYFALQDTDGKLIFGMFATGKDKICYMDKAYDNYDQEIEKFSNAWYTVDLDIDFEAEVLSGTITNNATGKVVKTFTEEPITTGAKNLGKMYAYDVYSAATLSIDNVFIK